MTNYDSNKDNVATNNIVVNVGNKDNAQTNVNSVDADSNATKDVKKRAWNNSFNNKKNIVNVFNNLPENSHEVAIKQLSIELKIGKTNEYIKERKTNFNISKKHAEILDKLKPVIEAMLIKGFSLKMIAERFNHERGIPYETFVDKETGKNMTRYVQVNIPYGQLLNWAKKEFDGTGLVKTKPRNK